MQKYYQDNDIILYEGKMEDVLETFESNSIDSIVTDPPYELNFMNKGWDNTGIAFQKETWEKCYRVLKPGGYLLAFGGSRTYHRIACAIEDAGFEIRDTIMWLYGSGFPKSLNIAKALEGKILNGSSNPKDFKKLNGEQTERGNWGYAKFQKDQGYRNKDYDTEAESETYLGKLIPTTELAEKWQGWGTQLKPAYEPVVVARKPIEKNVAENIMKYGVGGINIDECRVGIEERTQFSGRSQSKSTVYNSFNQDNAHYETVQGRFPSNVILTYDDSDYDEVCGGFPDTKSEGGMFNLEQQINDFNFHDEGNASRYFYCAKASSKDRDDGLDEFEKTQVTDGSTRNNSDTARAYGANKVIRKNSHPTVKPVELMQYLVRLVTPKSGTILDCFMGSGSTGKATMFENRERNANYKFIGIEMTEEYLPIAKSRIIYGRDKYEYDYKKFLEEEKEKTGQLSIEDFL